MLLTPLKGGNGEIYAVAQGAMVVSGFGADGSDGSSIQVNTKSAGRIPNGALVEREVGSVLNDGTNRITFNLHTADFTTARNMASAINNVMGSGTAEALDGVSVSVLSPVDPAQKVAYLAELENIDVGKAASAAKVIVNARSGTIVIGSEVIVSPAAVAHGSLTVTIDESVQVSQPGRIRSRRSNRCRSRFDSDRRPGRGTLICHGRRREPSRDCDGDKQSGRGTW